MQIGLFASRGPWEEVPFPSRSQYNTHSIAVIRQDLQAQIHITIDIFIYLKEGSPILNRLRIRPIYNTESDLMFFAGAQNPV